MSAIATVIAGNPIILPPAVIKALGIVPSSRIIFEIESNGKVSMTTKSATFSDLLSKLPKHKRATPATYEDIATAIKAGAAKRYRRAKP